ncbi:MAG TPA: hypothetical protein VMU04_15170 [Candidatus Acidoferrum sp.]|nr:hypothetical protein [Candidatus Acidoferrum sp.]
MKLVKLIEFLRTRLKAVVLGCYVVLGLVVLLDAIPAIVDKEHAHTSIEHWPGFWAVFGFVACVGIIIVSKWFGHAGIMVREDYYETNAVDNASAASNHGHPVTEHHD